MLERAGRDGWRRATYRLARDEQLLRFQLPARFYREQVWKVLTPGWRLESRGGDQVLISTTATDRIAVEFPV